MSKTIKRLLLSIIFLGAVSSSTPAYAWGSKEDVNTDDSHKMISVQALKMIRNDFKTDENLLKNLNLLEQNIYNYRKGSVAPDFGTLNVDRDYALYQDHFFDPDTGKNFTYSSWWYLAEKIDATAESQTRNYMSKAIAQWKEGNYSEAAYSLGKATHYFADLNEPHHASNSTGGAGTAHTQFENYGENVFQNYKITSMGSDKSEYNVFSENNLTEFLTSQCYKYAKLAKAQAPMATMSNSWEDWSKVADVTYKNAQKGTASVVYRFLKEVSNSGQSFKTPIGKFHVVVKTANEHEAGTDDYVYFGMKTKTGKTVEFECNGPGNDFGQAYVGSYEFSIDDPSFNPYDIDSVWFRKQKLFGDDWKPSEVDVYIQGQRFLHKDINEWLSGNTTYTIPVNASK